jgi:hypothetical protein
VPLQQAELGVERGFLDAQGGQDFSLAKLNDVDAVYRCAAVDAHGVPLDAAQVDQCGLIIGVREQLGLQVHLDDSRPICAADRVEEAHLGTRVRQASRALQLAIILLVELAGQLVGSLLQGLDARQPVLRLLGRLHRVVRQQLTA